jgi:hypothetical protein
MVGRAFHHPIALKVATNWAFIIASVESALEFLDHHWPEEGGEIYLRARQACLEALMNPNRVTAARHCFVDALNEAGFELIFELRVPPPPAEELDRSIHKSSAWIGAFELGRP